MKDRFVCTFFSHSSHYFAYDLAPNSVDANGDQVYLYQGQPLNNSWSKLGFIFTKNFVSTQVITVSDANNNDYVYIQDAGDGYSFIFTIDTNNYIHHPKFNISHSQATWISSIEKLTFYAINTLGGQWTIAKYQFVGSGQISEVTGIRQVSRQLYICQTEMPTGQISLKNSTCNSPIAQWKLMTGFSDASQFYLFVVVDNKKSSIAIFAKSAMSTHIGISVQVKLVPLREFFVCSAPPLSGSTRMNPRQTSSHKGAFIVIGVVVALITLLSCSALAVCFLYRPSAQGNSPFNGAPSMGINAPNPTASGSANVGKQVEMNGCVPVPTKCVILPKKKVSSKSIARGKVKRSTSSNSVASKNRDDHVKLSKSRSKKMMPSKNGNKVSKKKKKKTRNSRSRSSMKSSASRSRRKWLTRSIKDWLPNECIWIISWWQAERQTKNNQHMNRRTVGIFLINLQLFQVYPESTLTLNILLLVILSMEATV